MLPRLAFLKDRFPQEGGHVTGTDCNTATFKNKIKCKFVTLLVPRRPGKCSCYHLKTNTKSKGAQHRSFEFYGAPTNSCSAVEDQQSGFYDAESPLLVHRELYNQQLPLLAAQSSLL